MSGVWYGRCKGCNDRHALVIVDHLGLGDFTPALCVECEARLRLIGSDYHRLRYTIGQLLKKVPLDSLTNDLPQSAIAEITKVILVARDMWQKEQTQDEVQLGMPDEAPIPHDLMQQIQKQSHLNTLSPDYANYNIRQEDKIALHGMGVSWNLNDDHQLPKAQKPLEENNGSKSATKRTGS